MLQKHPPNTTNFRTLISVIAGESIIQLNYYTDSDATYEKYKAEASQIINSLKWK